MDVSLTPTDPQAAATIAAAHITADATVRASLIQAAAAVGAIGAGTLAYFGAVRQVRLQERAHEARAVAYRFRLSKVVQEYLAQVETAYMAAHRQLDTPGTQAAAPITSLFTQRPQTLHDDNWEAHALLGPQAVELILAIDDASLRLAQFDAEIRRVNVTTEEHFQAGTLTPSLGTAEGDVIYVPKRAIVDYVEVLGQLRRSLAELQAELAKTPRGSPWRRLRQLAIQPLGGSWIPRCRNQGHSAGADTVEARSVTHGAVNWLRAGSVMYGRMKEADMDHRTSASQLFGRLLTSAIFVVSGYGKLADPTATVAMMSKEGAPLPDVSMILAIVVELGGGLLILFGLFTRPAAVVLGIWCIATAMVAHSNWADFDMKIHFLKNFAMAGGFAYMAAFGAGAFSLDAVLFHRPLGAGH
jgi:putative oxidoreductase